MINEDLVRLLRDAEWREYVALQRAGHAEALSEFDRMLCVDLREALREAEADRDEAFADNARLRLELRELRAFLECASLHAENAA